MAKTVLVVDDSPLFLKAYDAALAVYPGEPIEVQHAGNGREALAKLALSPLLDLIILDVNMPVMDGPAFLAELRRDYASLDVPVVLSSTRAYATREQLGESAGVSAYLQKPFSPRELHTVLQALWGAPDAEGSAAR